MLSLMFFRKCNIREINNLAGLTHLATKFNLPNNDCNSFLFACVLAIHAINNCLISTKRPGVTSKVKLMVLAKIPKNIIDADGAQHLSAATSNPKFCITFRRIICCAYLFLHLDRF